MFVFIELLEILILRNLALFWARVGGKFAFPPKPLLVISYKAKILLTSSLQFEF